MGAAKSGTTSLHHVLARHPEVHMSAPLKEPRYFLPFAVARDYHRARSGLAIRSRAELRERFMLDGYRGQPAFGESTAEYTAGETSRRHGVPERMRAENPGLRLVYLVRHPLRRLVSHWRHLGRRGIDRPALSTLGEGGRDPHARILLQTGFYGWQLEPYRRCFGAERILVVVLERLAADPAAELARLFRFLGLDPEPARWMELPRLNQAGGTGPGPGGFEPAALELLCRRLRSEVAAVERWLGGPVREWNLSPEPWLASPARASTEQEERCGCT
jgi:hypothetical protein